MGTCGAWGATHAEQGLRGLRTLPGCCSAWNSTGHEGEGRCAVTPLRLTAGAPARSRALQKTRLRAQSFFFALACARAALLPYASICATTTKLRSAEMAEPRTMAAPAPSWMEVKMRALAPAQLSA